jgi:hypothetical protein
MSERDRLCPDDLAEICQRVRVKSVNYFEYNFSARYNDFLKAFFDLGQEYDSLDDFYRICIAVPLTMSGLPCALYLVDEKSEGLYLACDSVRGRLSGNEPAKPPVRISTEAYEAGNSYIVPIYSRSIYHVRGKDIAREEEGGAAIQGVPQRVFGMFEVKQLALLTPSDKFFYRKYCNRIGYNLHNKLMARQSIEHLKFINSLVMDIEHNVIVPNMYFRHIFNQLKKKINELGELKAEFRQLMQMPEKAGALVRCMDHCDALHDEMQGYYAELVKHHANLTLFLESLFRREHFKKGHLVLRTKRCFVEKEVIRPQLEHYESRLRAARVAIERPQNMLEEEFEIMVDVGLLAQVYANLFSNAAKYAEEVIDHHGRTRKALAYGRELVPDFPEKGRRGIKFNVFTTGHHLSEQEAYRLFEEGVRGPGSENVPGTGHGLAFIKHVVELHGGRVGYEPTPEGNNFYFILPIPPSPIPDGDGTA